MACRQSADCRHYNAWWCDRRSGCDDFEEKKTKSEPVIIPAEEPEKKQAKRKKADK